MSARRIVGFVVALLLAVTLGGNEPTPAAPIPVLASGGGGGSDPGGGGGDSVLAMAVNGASVGETVSFVISNQPENDPGGMCGDLSPWPYSPDMSYDATNQKVFHYGGIHGGDGHTLCDVVSIYNIATNAWESSEAVPDRNTNLTHGFDMADMDEAGTLYFGPYSTCSLRKRNSAGTYSNLATATGCYNNGHALAYHPGMDSGNGGIVYANALNLWWYEIDADTWHSLVTSGSAIMDDDEPCAQYVPALGVVLIGAGADSTSVYSVEADADFAYIAAPPIDVNCGSTSDGAGNYIVATNGGLRLFDFDNGDYYDFNGTSWGSSSSIDATFFASMDADKINARVYIPADAENGFDGDVILHIRLSGQSANVPNTTQYVTRLN